MTDANLNGHHTLDPNIGCHRCGLLTGHECVAYGYLDANCYLNGHFPICFVIRNAFANTVIGNHEISLKACM